MPYARVVRELAILDSNAYNIIALAKKYDQNFWLMGRAIEEGSFIVGKALIW
ncbi:MAG TPA: hypothetical protein VKV19_07520 [Ktedonobacteraceae bacterium]|jgi:hypothetical protein|nr:hypothetical protein [Ktedonobacteraceae bacterium]